MLKRFFKNSPPLFITLTLLVLGGTLLFAAPPDSPYEPGDTLDPTCAPGDPNCSVTSGADLSSRDSDDLEEGVENLYYTPGRVSSHVDVLANTGARHSPVTLSGANYLSLSGQILTAGVLDISSHTNLATGSGLLLTDDTLSASGLATTNFTSSNVSQWTNDAGYIASYIETDPVFAASAASGITAGDTTNWNASFGWGNHALQGYYGSGRKPFLKAVSSTEENFGSTTAGGPGNTTLTTPRRVWLESNQDTTLGSVGIRAETGHFDSQGSRTYRLRVYDSSGAGDIGTLLYEESFARSFPVGWDVREIDLPLTTPIAISVNDIFVIEVVITNPTAQNPDSWTSLVLTPQLGTYADALDFDGVPINWYIGFGAAEKGVVGPLDEADLPGYALSTEGQVLARTASGVAFVDQMSGLIAQIDYVDGEEERNDGASTTSSSYSSSYGQLQALDDFSLGKVTFESNIAGEHTLEIQSSTGLETYRTATASGGPGWITFELDEALGLAAGSTYRFRFTPPSNTNVRYSSSSHSGSLWAMSSIHFVGFGDFGGSLSMGLIPRELGAESGIPISALSSNGTISFSEFNGTLTLGVTPVDVANTAYLDLTDTPDTFTSNVIPFINSSGNALVHSSSLTFDENRLSVLGIPSGVTVSDGIFYLNAPQLTGDSVVAWEAEPAWDLATIGSDSHPALVDVDGDGDLDLMTGGANVVGYENTGTNISPVWTRNAGWDIPDTGYLHDAPAFADIDNDGDFDVYIGHGDNNSIRAYENTGTASAPVWTRRAGWDVPGSISINYAKYTRPTFADLDNDGDFDIMYGRSDGAIQTYENTGTISSPAWTIRNEWSPPNVGGSSAPFLYDFDNDGDFDVLIGTGGTTPRAYAYENTGTVTYPEWTAKPEWDTPSPGSYIVAPAVADLDNDGDGDVLLGLSNGTTKGYANIGALGSGENNTLFGIAVGGNERLRLSGNGDLSVFGDMHSTGFINTSTEEAKDDITFLSLERGRNILNDIRTLDIANYRYLSDETGEPLRLGLIAERSPREILSRDGKGVDLYKLSTFTLAGLKSLTENVDRIENALLINGVSLGSDDALVVEGEEQNPLVRALQKLGLVVNDGILSLKKLMGQEVQTEKLCVGETCVTEKELVELLKNSRVEPYSEETVEDNESSILEEENKEFVEEVAKEEVETETGLTEETSITEELQSETEESGGEMSEEESNTDDEL